MVVKEIGVKHAQIGYWITKEPPESESPRLALFTTRNSSYRSWQERVRKERPAYLTIVSLELPEAPVPLIESQGSGRNDSDANRSDDKDDILDELLEKKSEEAGRLVGMHEGSRHPRGMYEKHSPGSP
ncbi:hypothetical protein HZH68_015808 [Vespula germanica]|uniref:Uncharacterized protein n=1 Tax=Vespula germanica TaxID=30212 RepID=A0A834MRI7_VESGE|nr:hypothetical protein HZH68_015808 [Vespula germanica]